MKIFKEVIVGGVSRDGLIHRLVQSGVQWNDYAKILFEHRDFSPDGPVEKHQLVKVRPSDFGLVNPYSLESAVSLGSHLGLRPCPLSLAAFLRLEYLDQAEGPYLTVASVRPASDENGPAGFYLRNFENSLWLRGYRAAGECDFPSDNEFVFSL